MKRRILSMLLSIMMCITILPMVAFAADDDEGPKAYAVLDEEGTLTIGYWDTKPEGAYEVPNLSAKECWDIPWHSKRNDIKKVVFDSSIKNYKPTSTTYWFDKCSNLVSVENANYLDTSAVIDMSYMFFCCSSLTTIDVSKWDTSSVTNMNSMFDFCKELKSIDVSNWDTSSVTGMSSMFYYCTRLATLDVSNWDTSSVTRMYFMFSNCGLLTSLDVSNWDTSSVTDMDCMFQCCYSLKNLDVSSWDTSSVTKMCGMFNWCQSMTALDVSNWDTSSVTDMDRMFGYCYSLQTLDLSGWDLSSVVYDSENIHGFDSIFHDCSKLKTIYASNDLMLSDSVKENSTYVFENCASLKGGAGTAYNKGIYDANKGNDANYAHIDGGESNPGYFTFGYHMSFDIGEGTTGTAPESIFVTTGKQVELPSASSFSKMGYLFSGWSDGNKSYDEGETFTVGTEVVNFTAVWEKCSHEHTEVKDAKTATLTTEGYTGDTYCTDCGAKIADGKAIPTLTPEPTPTTKPGGNGGSGNGNGGSGTTIPTPTTPPTQKPTGNATKSAGEFVERCYNVCLGRSSDAEGYKYWLDMLNSGDSCGAEVGYGFVFSPEYILKNTSNEQFVKDMYSMFFGREADAEGFNSWVEQLNNGASRLQVYAGFASSPEFSNLCGEYGIIGVSILNDDAINEAGDIGKFVGRLYKICLSRYPDYCGFTAWTKGLQEGSKTGSTCAYGFIFSGEFMSRGLSNEEFVVYMYKVFFDREADEAGYNLWLSVLNNGGSYEEVFNGFTGSPEFAILCASYGINA